MYEKLGYNLKIKVEGFDEILTQNIIDNIEYGCSDIISDLREDLNKEVLKFANKRFFNGYKYRTHVYIEVCNYPNKVVVFINFCFDCSAKSKYNIECDYNAEFRNGILFENSIKHLYTRARINNFVSRDIMKEKVYNHGRRIFELSRDMIFPRPNKTKSARKII